MRTTLVIILSLLPLLPLNAQEDSTALPFVLIEEIQSELQSGRISFDDAELLTEWIEHVDGESLRNWIDTRTDLSSEFIALLQAWLDRTDSNQRVADSLVSTDAKYSVSTRIGFRTRDEESTIREFLSLQAQLDRTTKVSIDFNHANDDSVQIRRRSIRIRPTAGLIDEITLGSFSTKLGTGLLFAPSRTAISPTGTIPDGFLFSSGREMNGILLKSEIGKMALQLLSSIRKRNDTSHILLATEMNYLLTSEMKVGFALGLSSITGSTSSNAAYPGSLIITRRVNDQSIEIEIGGLLNRSLAHPGLNSRFKWVTGSDMRLQHRLICWWYDPDWLEIAGNGGYLSLSIPEPDTNALGSSRLRAGQYGFRYEVRREKGAGSHGILPRLAVVFGRRAADTFGVMLEPAIRLPLQNANPLATTHLELVGQLRTRKPARTAAFFLDEAEALTAEFQFKRQRTEIAQKIGLESLNEQRSFMSQLIAQMRIREWSFAGRGLIRNVSKDQRSSWRITTEIRRIFADRSIFLRSFIENSTDAERNRRKLFVLETGLAWRW